MVIEGFFLTATDARYAIRDLRRAGQGKVDSMAPVPVQPNNGRPWRVDVDVDAGSMAERYSKPVLVNEVVGIIRRHNGITEQVDRV